VHFSYSKMYLELTSENIFLCSHRQRKRSQCRQEGTMDMSQLLLPTASRV
jgi:hypothetical protein